MFIYDEINRKHTLDGKPIPSVTQVIEVCDSWLKTHRQDENVKYALEKGRSIHLACELFDKGLLSPEPNALDSRIQPYLESWIKFLNTFNPKWISIEQPLFNQQYRFCGKPDRVATIDGKITVIDLKHGAYIETYKLQCAAYAEMCGAKDSITVILDENGDTPKIVRSSTHQADWSTFLCFLGVWRFKNNK